MNTNWREDLAWAAGFFDGEGTIGGYSKLEEAHICFSLRVYQTERTTLERFHRAVLGIGSVVGPYFRKDRKAHHKPAYTYDVSGHRQVQAVIAMLWPFLSQPKKEQAKKALRRLPLKPDEVKERQRQGRRTGKTKTHDLG